MGNSESGVKICVISKGECRAGDCFIWLAR